MTTIAQVKERIQELLEERADHVGRETGFVKRERQLSGADFVQGLVFGLLHDPEHSTEELATILGRRAVHISASGLCQRFTEEAATFLLRLLEDAVALGLEAADAAPVDLLARFDAVVIEDSSTIRLPDKLADLWQSCGGGQGQSQAGLKLHVRWDLEQGGLQGPLLTPSRVAEQSSPLRQQGIAAGVLNITDEAYCSLEWLRTQPGMFLSRPRSTVCFLDRENEQVLDLEQIGPQAVGQSLDREVLVLQRARWHIERLFLSGSKMARLMNGKDASAGAFFARSTPKCSPWSCNTGCCSWGPGTTLLAVCSRRPNTCACMPWNSSLPWQEREFGSRSCSACCKPCSSVGSIAGPNIPAMPNSCCTGWTGRFSTNA